MTSPTPSGAATLDVEELQREAEWLERCLRTRGLLKPAEEAKTATIIAAVDLLWTRLCMAEAKLAASEAREEALREALKDAQALILAGGPSVIERVATRLSILETIRQALSSESPNG